MNKMLLLQTDYLTVDAFPYSSWTDHETWDKDIDMRLLFTIQCNGKIRRHDLIVPLSKLPEKSRSSISIWWMEIANYDVIYKSFEMLFNLWYDVPLHTDIHPLISKAMEYIINN